MDIRSISNTGIGSLQLDDIRLGGNLANSNAVAGNLPSFEEVLKNATPKSEVSQNAASADALSSNAAAFGGGVTIDRDSELFQQCLELETFLVKTLVTTMRSTVQKSGLVEQGLAGDMYEDMLYDEYAKEVTKNANFGMADLAYLELTGQRGMVIQR